MSLEQVIQLTKQLPPEDRLDLFKHLASDPMLWSNGEQEASLRGSWAQYFPAELQIDDELRRIREGWQTEIEDVNV